MTTPQDDGGPAFPLQDWDEIIRSRRIEIGMSLRDYFAAKAIHGATEWSRKKSKESMHDLGYDEPHHQPCLPEFSEDGHCEEIARACYAIADAMLAARKERA